MSNTLAPAGSRVEKSKSPAPKVLPVWCRESQNRPKATQREYLLLQEKEEPDSAELRQSKVEMMEPSDSVQNQLFKLDQQIVLVLQVCAEENGIVLEDFQLAQKWNQDIGISVVNRKGQH